MTDFAIFYVLLIHGFVIYMVGIFGDKEAQSPVSQVLQKMFYIG